MRRASLSALIVAAALGLSQAALGDSVTNMTFHGGRVMLSSTTHAIFWLPPGTHYEPASGNPATDAANDTNYENLLIRYFQDVGGSDIYNTTTQYSGSNGTIANSSSFGGSVVDTNAYPSAGTVADPITRAELEAEVNAVRTAQGWPDGLGAVYFIYTGYRIQSCLNSSACSYNSFCAYHTAFTSGGSDWIVWANMPDARSLNDPGGSVCDDFQPNGDRYADVEVNVTSHEHLEAVTDPLLDAWYDDVDGLGGENADKCAYTYGVVNSVDANIYMGSHPYRLQREWSNAINGINGHNGCAMSYSTSAPFINQPTLTMSASLTPSTTDGNTSSSLNYHVSVNNPSNAEPATNVVINTTLPAGLVRTGGAGLSINVGNIAVHDTKAYDITVSPSTPLLDGTVLTVTSSTGYKDSLDTVRPTIAASDSATVVNAPPTISLPGPQSQDYHDVLSFPISASGPETADPLTLSASGLPAGLALTDNGNGTGTVTGTIQAIPGVYVATFAVDDHHHVSPVTGTVVITVTKEETALHYTGPTVIANGFPITLSARLLEDDVLPIAGRTVTLGLGAQSCTGTTDAAGIASCSLVVSASGGSVPITATFAGDAFYLPSSDSATALVFSFLARGAFTLGDATVAAAGPTTQVTWWSSAWAKVNTLTNGNATDSFKGFAGALTPASPPACGGTWTTRPGNSTPPVSAAAIPQYMGVVVSSSITKSGSVIAGDIAKIVVVRTNPGYSPAPGHAGTGTIVGMYC
jgi:hypothetical protein